MTAPESRPSNAMDPHLAEALDWLIQLDDADAATRARFDAWLAASPENARAFRHASTLWDSPLLSVAAVGLEKHAERAATRQRRRRWRGFAAAAGLLLA
ncbi:FecR/PupR family sigma factor regulator, partial [Pseudomonas citronellolis]|uniref:FecR/PupR family sigma factor regulator n=1 Tax=Pseudomonas citronellolis TaxID=53408 RepID=UPI0023E45F63